MCIEAPLHGRIVMTLLALATLLPGATRAASIESLLSPGKLSESHAKLEGDCANCHDKTDRSRQTGLCLSCHKDVAGDVARKDGLHGRLPNISTGECKACHSEHLGRDADIVKLAAASFDHRGTDFPLTGAHAGVACASCHTKGRAYRDASSSCGACHKADDVHRGGLGANCGACHATATWTSAKFDHDKTRFPLHGAHQSITCNTCHVSGVYKDLPRTCISCHAPDDAHKGSRGENCGECHKETSWTSARFDHAKETGFALLGKHAALDCAGCHKSPKFDDKPPKTCVGCHRSDDAHAARFGEDCASCHGNDAWRGTEFDHAGRTKFPLQGAHVRLDCHACHTAASATQKLPTDCASCHRGSDVHGGALKDCASCHGNESWRKDLAFDHDLTAFPLLGMHVVVGCGQCHATRAFAGTPHDCIACHRSSDVHKGSLGKECGTCHSPNGWNLWEFDHGKQTRFALTGRHGQLHCTDCHRRPAAELKLPTDCASCHRDDDIHVGQFGAQCQRCHTTLTFKGARIQ
jgi:hypothetical protein